LRRARLLAVLVFVGAGLAALVGLLDRSSGFPRGSAAPAFLTNAWGESVRMEAGGIYRRDSFSAATQERAQDLVTLVLGLPLLAAAFFASARGGRLGKLLLSGALGYFLYCYGMMAVGTAYNELFLLYVGLFSASLYGFILSLMAIDLEEVAAAASAYPRKSVAVFCLLVAFFLGFNWLGSIILPSLLGARVPAGLDAAGTLFVQSFDLGILVPAAALGAFWLLRRDPRGLVLGTVLLVKGSAEGFAVAAMGFSMLASGISEALGLVLGFLALALGALVLGIWSLWSLRPRMEVSAERPV
jgi:hypothetical protein